METTGMIVRDATVDDATAMTEAHVRAWQVAYRGIMPDRYLDDLSKHMADRVANHRVQIASPDDPRQIRLVAEHDGRVIGFFIAGPSRDDDTATDGTGDGTGEVWAVYIHPDSWRLGAGSALMTEGLERLKAAGFTEATLWVFEGNGRARGFYERHGWRQDGATEIFERGGGQAIEVRYRRPL
jgi:ribosomal protein S18 acetylase RimI-like enzyme